MQDNNKNNIKLYMLPTIFTSLERENIKKKQ